MMTNSASFVVIAILLCSMAIDFSSQKNILSRNNSDSEVYEDTNINSNQFKVIQTSQKKSESSEEVTQIKRISKENYTPAVNKINYLSNNSMIGYSDVLAPIWKETDAEGENTPTSRSFLKKVVNYISRHTDIDKNVTKTKNISDSFYNETFGDVDVLAEIWNGSDTKGENIPKLRSFLKKMTENINRHIDIDKNVTKTKNISDSFYNETFGDVDVLAEIWNGSYTKGENIPKLRSFLKKMTENINRHIDIDKNVTKIKDISESFYNETFGDVDVLAEIWNRSNTKGENIPKFRSFLKKITENISRHTDIGRNVTEPKHVLESSYNETISDDDGLAGIWNGTDSTEGENIPKRKFYESEMVDYNSTLIDMILNNTEIKDVSESSDSSNYESSSDDYILAELWNGTDIEEEYIPKHMFLDNKIDDPINNSSNHGLLKDNQLKERRSRTNVSKIQAPRPPSFENDESVQTTSSKNYRRKIYAEDILVMRRNRYRETTYKWDFLVTKKVTLSTKKRIPFKLRDFPNCIEEEPLIWICTKSCHNIFKSICFGFACPPRLNTLEHMKCVKHCSREIRARRQFTTRKITTTSTTTTKKITKPKITTTTSTTTKPKPICQKSVFDYFKCWIG